MAYSGLHCSSNRHNVLFQANAQPDLQQTGEHLKPHFTCVTTLVCTAIPAEVMFCVCLFQANAEPDLQQTGERLKPVVDGLIEGIMQLVVDSLTQSKVTHHLSTCLCLHVTRWSNQHLLEGEAFIQTSTAYSVNPVTSSCLQAIGAEGLQHWRNPVQQLHILCQALSEDLLSAAFATALNNVCGLQNGYTCQDTNNSQLCYMH